MRGWRHVVTWVHASDRSDRPREVWIMRRVLRVLRTIRRDLMRKTAILRRWILWILSGWLG